MRLTPPLTSPYKIRIAVVFSCVDPLDCGKAYAPMNIHEYQAKALFEQFGVPVAK